MKFHGFKEVEWELGKDKKGQLSLLLGKRAVHSLYNAEKQADKQAEQIIRDMEESRCNFLILIGVGLGYLQQALLNKGLKGCLILEPFPIMRQHLPLCKTEWKKQFRVICHLNLLEEAILKIATPKTAPYARVHPGYEPYCRMEYRLVKEFLSAHFPSSSGLNDKSSIISYRSVENLAILPSLATMEPLVKAYSSQKAIIASPGPSLKPCIPFLKDRKEGILIASLQALPLLQKNKVPVDYVVIADPNDLTTFFSDCTHDFGTLLVDSSASPLSLQWCPEKTMLYHLKHRNLHKELYNNNSCVIAAPISTVSETMVLLAGMMGFHQMLFIGMDFSWKEERYSYRTPGTPSGKDHHFRIHTKNSETAITDPAYFHAGRYLNHACETFYKKGLFLCQYTEGFVLNNTSQITPQEINKFLCEDTPHTPPKSEQKIDKQKLKLAEELLLKASNSQEFSNYVKSKATNLSYAKRMPFFNEMPPEERKEACSKALENLQQLKE